MENALVIGGGQIGSFTSASLKLKGYTVVIIDRAPVLDYIARYGENPEVVCLDILDVGGMDKIFMNYKPSLVVLCAGMSARATKIRPSRAKQIQVEGTRIVAEMCLKYKVKKLIYISSLAVYGSLKGVGAITEWGTLNPESEYGKIKLEVEKLLTLYRGKEIDIKILRPSGIYGPIVLDRGSQSSRMFEKLLVCGLNRVNTTFEIAENIMDEYLYVADIAHAISLVAISTNHTNRFIYNVGSSKTTSIQQLEKAFKEVLPEALFKFHFLSSSYSNRKFLDTTAIEEDYGFEIQYSLVTGLKHYLQLYHSPSQV